MTDSTIDIRPRKIELLAPAKDKEVARQAILHGADAVYMGASSHGARRNAANSIDDVREVVDFAHIYRAKVYATVNTVVLDNELRHVERLINDLYIAGVDALIVQDMGILRMDIPPIELHASTQCDTRSLQKARFLADAGFSQIVLARELTLEEIREICRNVDARIECFIHGALCVCYSGRCQASLAAGSRSANRGECAQICRLPWTLYDGNGKILQRDKHLLSLRDLNLSDEIASLLDAGVSSLKIEGRLKDAGYVKNIVSHYRNILDGIIAANPKKYSRSSFGTSEITFDPVPEKSFNRGFTRYFLTERRPSSIASIDAPGHIGEKITDVSQLNTGDGITFKDNTSGKISGAYINGIEGGKILTSSGLKLSANTQIRRTFDRKFDSLLSKSTATRRIAVDFILDNHRLTATDERGNRIVVPLDFELQTAKTRQDRKPLFAKLGNTPYRLRDFTDNIPSELFIPNSVATDLRRRALKSLNDANLATYPLALRKVEKPGVVYISDTLDYRDNVTNRLARKFYEEHGVRKIEPGTEASGKPLDGRTVMTCRYCMLRELGMCLKDSGKSVSLPLTIRSGDKTFRLAPDCKNCEMSLIKISNK